MSDPTTAPPIEHYKQLSREERLARIAHAPGELARAIEGRGEATLARRPDAKNWAPVEVICHLRGNEEWFLIRLQQIMLMHEPRFVTTSQDRWAEDRQYLKNDARLAIEAFARSRAESLAFFRGLDSDDWKRAGFHSDARGRRTIDGFLTVMAWHDDNHLAQLRRALEGRA